MFAFIVLIDIFLTHLQCHMVCFLLTTVMIFKLFLSLPTVPLTTLTTLPFPIKLHFLFPLMSLLPSALICPVNESNTHHL